MNSIEKLSQGLNLEIRNSETYHSYMDALQKLKSDQAGYEKFTNFNHTHMDFQARKLRGEQPAFDEEKYISSLYAEICLSENIRSYIECRNALMALIYKTQEIVYGDIQMEF